MALRSSGRCRSINIRSRNSSNNTLVDFMLLLQSLTLALLCLSCFFDSSTTSSTSTTTPTTVLQVQALAFSLTPHTLPVDILERQLTLLQLGDMIGAYRLASPANQAGSGNNVTNFGKMVRAPPYSPLVRHKKAQILLQSRMFDSQQFLVRVVSSSSSPDLEEEEEDEDEESACSSPQKKRRKTTNKVSEYWWSLSRSNSGPAAGSYMVDAVIPNRM